MLSNARQLSLINRCCQQVFVLNRASDLVSVIVKWGDDLRQELLCSQLLEQFRVCVYTHIPTLYTCTYTHACTYSIYMYMYIHIHNNDVHHLRAN